MTRDALASLVAEYVLGTLEPDARDRLDRDLAIDPAVSARVGDWQRMLTPLAGSVEPVEPPEAVWREIEAALAPSYPELPGTTTVRADEGVWRPIAEGVTLKLLWTDETRHSQSFLLRLEPGASLPGHHHAQYEECLVLEGGIEIGPKALAAGDYHLAHPGVPHPPVTSRSGGLLFVRAELDELGH